MNIKSTPKERLEEDLAQRLYQLYNQDGVTPLNIIPNGVEFLKDGYKVEATIKARKLRD